MSIYRVSHSIFEKADKQLKEVRLIKSQKTGLWYISSIDVAHLIGVKPETLTSHRFRHVWNDATDGEPLKSLKQDWKPLKNYFSVHVVCEHFLYDDEQRAELATWQTRAIIVKISKKRHQRDEESARPLRKRTSSMEKDAVLQERAIERLMQQPEIRQRAIELAARQLFELAKAKQAKESLVVQPTQKKINFTL